MKEKRKVSSSYDLGIPLLKSQLHRRGYLSFLATAKMAEQSNFLPYGRRKSEKEKSTPEIEECVPQQAYAVSNDVKRNSTSQKGERENQGGPGA